MVASFRILKKGYLHMTAMLSFFPVDNGDMTLVAPESGRTLLIDLNIRAAADDPTTTRPMSPASSATASAATPRAGSTSTPC